MPRVRLLDHRGRPLPPRHRDAGPLRAKYDAAQTSDDLKNHWTNADTLSARAANDPETRRKLRARARYERDNNSYCSGMCETLANDCIGTGPRLQPLMPDPAVNRRLADAFEAWSSAAGLAETLRTYREARAVDGESFAVLATNPALPTPVKLDLRLVEADQVATPYAYLPTQYFVDGIEYDADHNPAYYHVLREHPGDLLHFGQFGAFDRVPADQVLHWFQRRRPGQCRGVPEITPSLPLFALLRRYDLATVTAAEVAALFAALLKTSAPPSDDTEAQGDTIQPFDRQEITRGMMVALPEGYDAVQLRPEHPATTHEMFVKVTLRGIARCLHIPYAIAAGDLSDTSYSSGQLGYQNYRRTVGIDRYFLECHVLDRVLAAWLAEARLADPKLLAGLPPGVPRHQWYWDGFRHYDPAKEADAQSRRLANGTTSLQRECAEEGYDWREVADENAAARAYYAARDLPFPGDAAPAPAPADAPGPDDAQEPPPMPRPAPPPRRAAAGRLVANRPADADAGPARLTTAGAPVAIHAAKGEGKRPRFDIVGYTGGPMSVAGFFYPVIIELTGLRAPGPRIPALRNHDDDRIVGQTDAIQIGQDVRLAGEVTGENADAQEVVSQARNGFLWQASIGADVVRREFLEAGTTATVNGRQVAGPMIVVREAQLYEISFVALGADGATSASVAASSPSGSHQGATMSFEQWLAARGFPDPTALSDPQRTSLRAIFDAEAARPTPAPAPAPPPVPGQPPAATPPSPFAQTLDQILNAQRDEQRRVEEITRITAQALAERPLMTDELERMSRAAIEHKTPPIEFELAILRATRARVAGPAVHARDRAVSARVVEAAMCRALGLRSAEKHYDAPTLEAADRRHPHGVGLQELLLLSARENGHGGLSVRSDLEGVLHAAFPRRRGEVQAEGFSTLSLPGILSNVANKFLIDAFNAVEGTWREIAAVAPVNDFKAMTSYSLTGDLMYEKVGPAGEIKHGTVGELSYSNQAETYAKMLAITRKDIINDDLGALTKIPRRLGRGAALKINDVFWTVFLAGVGTYWTSGRANLVTGAGTALAFAGLDTANAVFLKQTDPDGRPLAAMPKILLVPPELSVTADELMSSTIINTGGSSTLAMVPNANVWRNKFRPVSSVYLSNSSYTGYSTTAWWLIADPADIETIQVCFLNGRETPVVESADADFDTLGIQFRGFHDFGVALMEFRGSVRAQGT